MIVDLSGLAQYGLSGIAIGLIILLAYALKMFHDSYRENTKAIYRLSNVIDKQTQKEQMFMDAIYPIAKDTNERVRRMEEKL